MKRSVSTHAIVLAGGRGTRIQHVTRALGEPPEKQFCKLGGDRTLLRRSVDRLGWLEQVVHTSVVVRRDHAMLAAEQLASHPNLSLIAQPGDRGTGVAVLTGLLHRLCNSNPITILSPADHGFLDEQVVRAVLSEAIEEAALLEAPILIGAAADQARTDYGWILPADDREIPRVERFVEKPPGEVATELLRSGGMFNTMLMVAPTRALIDAFEEHADEAFTRLLPAAFMRDNGRSVFLQWAFSQIESIDFSKEIVAQCDNLRVKKLPVGAGWTDLGNEKRLLEYLDRQRTFGARRAKSRVKRVVRAPRPPAAPADKFLN